MAQAGDVFCRFQAGIDQLFQQRTDDAIAASVDLADFIRMQAGGFDHAAGAGIDYGGDAAGLGVEGIFDCHRGSLGANR